MEVFYEIKGEPGCCTGSSQAMGVGCSGLYETTKEHDSGLMV